jgi:hypothetical protein
MWSESPGLIGGLLVNRLFSLGAGSRKRETRMSKLLDLLLGFCAHNRCTFPISLKPGKHRPEAAEVTGIYVVCLDCGKEFAYSWDKMRVVSGPSGERAKSTTTLSAPTAEISNRCTTQRIGNPKDL